MTMEKTQIVEGVSYLILLDPEEIRTEVLAIVKKEWEKSDFDVYGKYIKNAQWRLEKVATSAITFGPDQPDQKDLAPRIATHLKLLEKKTPIPPLILKGDDLLIFDGYARINALRKKAITTCLAYVGNLVFC